MTTPFNAATLQARGLKPRKGTKGEVAFRIDESMFAQFATGDIIVIDKQVSPEPGDFIVASAPGLGLIFMEYNCPTITPIKVIGVMVEHRQRRLPGGCI